MDGIGDVCEGLSIPETAAFLTTKLGGCTESEPTPPEEGEPSLDELVGSQVGLGLVDQGDVDGLTGSVLGGVAPKPLKEGELDTLFLHEGESSALTGPSRRYKRGWTRTCGKTTSTRTRNVAKKCSTESGTRPRS